MEKNNKEFVLSQWQTCVEMANSISQRRDAMNNLFVTLNLAIIAAISFVWNVKSILLLLAGMILCVIWILFIRNFKLLNAEKFKIINDMEKLLPQQPFAHEWKNLKKTKYIAGTKLEQALPAMFIILYLIALLMLLHNKIF